MSLDPGTEPDPRLFMQIAADLRAQIANGSLAPGQKVPSVTYLSQQWGTARQTAAKALRLLAREGLLTYYSGTGYRIAHPAAYGNTQDGEMPASGAPGRDQGKDQIREGGVMTPSEREKAERWDRLLELLESPRHRSNYLIRLSARRRAVLLLLAGRGDLPPSLTRELEAYQITLDALWLEAGDGFDDSGDILNLIPVHLIRSLIGGLPIPDTDDGNL